MIDWNAAEQSLVNGLAWGIGFSVTVVTAITWAALKVLSHPTVRKLSNAADKLSSGGGWASLAEKGARALGIIR